MKNSILLLLLFWVIGCGTEDIPQYYNDVARRTSVLLKFDKTDLDIFDHRLKATFETVIDVSNADTAHRITFAEIDFPIDESARNLFKSSVDFLDYTSFINALNNQLKNSAGSIVPLKFSANADLDAYYDREAGLTLTDSAGVAFMADAEQSPVFIDFLESARKLAETGPAERLSAEIDYIDSVISGRLKAMKKKYRYRELSLGKSTFTVTSGDAKSDRWQVDCKFSVYNPNAFDCKFLANFNLISEKGGVLFSFKAEDFVVSAGKRQYFTAHTVLKKFQAERIGNVQTQISNVTTDDMVAQKYME